MPTYQYACTACDERLEVQQSFADAALTECPACAGRLRKVFSAVGVVFKGSGFYKNDSRTPEKGREKTDASSDSGDASSQAGDKTAASPGEERSVSANGAGPSDKSPKPADPAVGSPSKPTRSSNAKSNACG